MWDREDGGKERRERRDLDAKLAISNSSPLRLERDHSDYISRGRFLPDWTSRIETQNFSKLTQWYIHSSSSACEKKASWASRMISVRIHPFAWAQHFQFILSSSRHLLIGKNLAFPRQRHLSHYHSVFTCNTWEEYLFYDIVGLFSFCMSNIFSLISVFTSIDAGFFFIRIWIRADTKRSSEDYS